MTSASVEFVLVLAAVRAERCLLVIAFFGGIAESESETESLSLHVVTLVLSRSLEGAYSRDLTE